MVTTLDFPFLDFVGKSYVKIIPTIKKVKDNIFLKIMVKAKQVR